AGGARGLVLDPSPRCAVSARYVSVGCSLALTACVGASGPEPSSTVWMQPATGMKDATSGSAAEVFFPLVDGNVYLYATQNELGEPGVLTARVSRTDAKHGELRYGSGSKRFTYADDGVVYESKLGPAYVLKLPLQVGTTWRGEHGGNTKILAMNTTVEV